MGTIEDNCSTLTYQLLDFGGGRKLERFGRFILDRVCPASDGIDRANADVWKCADLRLDDRGEVIAGRAPVATSPWCVRIAGIQFNLRLTPFGHVGLFPEQADNWSWLQDWPKAQLGTTCQALNLFAYTGGSTMALAMAGFHVAHVDASAPAVRWARENAASNQLNDRPIRWIVEDARKFVSRELKRGRRYDLIVMDPPSFGHGPSGNRWQIETDLFPLLETCLQLLSSRAALLLTAHSENPSIVEIEKWLKQTEPSPQIQSARLVLRDPRHRSLDNGFCMRWQKVQAIEG